MPPQLVSTNIDDWLTEVLDEVSASTEVTVHRHFTASTDVPIDPDRLQRAVLNLFTNACQALAEQDVPPPALTVETARLSERVELRFIDNGPGIREDQLAHVLEPLVSTRASAWGWGYRSSNALPRRTAGVSNCAARQIKAQQPFSGCRYPVRILATMSTLQLLVVDDDPDFARSLARVFELHGHEVTIALSGAQAVDACSRQPFDLAFIDLSMPSQDGTECLAEIRSHRPGAQAVIMTGYGYDPRLDNIAAQGVLGTLQKPFALEDALAMVQRITPRPEPS